MGKLKINQNETFNNPSSRSWTSDLWISLNVTCFSTVHRSTNWAIDGSWKSFLNSVLLYDHFWHWALTYTSLIKKMTIHNLWTWFPQYINNFPLFLLMDELMSPIRNTRPIAFALYQYIEMEREFDCKSKTLLVQ